MGRHPEYELSANALSIMRQRIPVLAQIREISETIRKKIFDSFSFSSDGACLYSSLVLQKALAKYGPDIKFTVCGGSPDSADVRYDGQQGILGKDKQWHSHYWVGFELLDEQFVVDISADQFGYEEVVIMPSQYYGSPYIEGSRELVAERVKDLVNKESFDVR